MRARTRIGLLSAFLLPISATLSIEADTAKSAVGPAARPPNILLVFLDDVNYAGFGVTGGKLTPTPHMDSVALNGTQFTQAYVTASTCSPSRAGLMTGRYQQRFGHENNTGGERM